MFTSFSKYLAVLLAMLQLVAPLVHAHTNEDHNSHKFHIPGYEHYNIANQTGFFQAITNSTASDCSIISIATGIKHKKSSSDQSNVCFLPEALFCFTTHKQYKAINERLFQANNIPTPHYTHLPSRAPPIYNLA